MRTRDFVLMKQNLSNDDFNAIYGETIIASELQLTG